MKRVRVVITLLLLLSSLGFSGKNGKKDAANANVYRARGPVTNMENDAPRISDRYAPNVFTFADDFDGLNDTTDLKARGYKPYYRGTGAQAAPTWFSPSGTVFPAYNGPATGFVGANYQVVSGTNVIDSWLVLPRLSINAGDPLKFYERSPTGSIYPDSIMVLYSAAGDSVPEAGSWVVLDYFETNITGTWTQHSYPAPSTGANARFAIRYYIVDGGPSGTNSNYIGIDALTVGLPPSHDVSAFVLRDPPSGGSVTPGSAITPKAVFKNLGGTVETFNVRFRIDSAGTNKYDSGLQPVTSLAVGDTALVTFASIPSGLPGGVYTMKAFSLLAGDANTLNDTLTGLLTVAPQISGYVFSASSGAFTPLSGAVIPEPLGGSGGDDDYYNHIPIGFNFTYNGTTYDSLSAVTNGFLALGSDSLTSAPVTNNLKSGATTIAIGGTNARPILAPLWDDLLVDPSNFRYLTTGGAGTHVFTAEWDSVHWDYTALGAQISFQVKLYEADGKIEFIYRQDPDVVTSGSPSIGITDVGTGNGHFLSLDGTGVAPAAHADSEYTLTGTKPATGQVYTFVPPFAQTYTSSTVAQDTSRVPKGAVNQKIIGIQVVASGSTSPLSVTRFKVNANGTTSVSDISNAKIFYTGTSSTFAAVNQFGSAVPSPTVAPYAITGSQTLSNGTNYFWLTYNISAGATTNNIADAECDSVTVGGVNRRPTVTAPAGGRTIKPAFAAGDYTIGVSLFNRLLGRELTFEKSTRKVLRDIPVVDNGDISRRAIQAFSVLDNIQTRRVEVDEVVWTLMDQGKPYTGRARIDLTDADRVANGLNNDVLAAYPTITAALADLNLLGVAGPVQFLLIDTSYPTETFPLTINNVSGASATNTIKIRPQTAVTTTVSGSSSVAIFKLNGADYVTIDGSNTGGTDRNMTISNSNTSTGSAVIWIASTAIPADSANNNTIKNCIVTGNSATTTFIGIVSSGSVLGGVAEAQNTNNTMRNNAVSKVQYGLAAVGATANESGLLMTQNSIGVTDTISFNGIAVFQQHNATISNNTISKVVSTSSSTSSGIRVAGTAGTILINANRISDIKNTNTTGWGSNGVQLNASVATGAVTVANNFIWDVASYGYNSGASVSDNGYGIVAVTGGGYNIYHNSINLNTDQTVIGRPAAFNVTSGITTAATIDVRNNIFRNSQTIGDTNRYSVYCGAANTVFSTINYNDYSTLGANIGFLGTKRAALLDWQTATGQDANSKAADPLYLSGTDLHIVNGASPASNAGVHIVAVANDIDGDVRNASTPDMGADEFAGSSLTSLNVPVANSWNLVSLPLSGPTPGNLVQQVYTTSATATAFKFTGTYVTTTTLDPGPGYWIKSTSAFSQSITGTAIDSLTIPLSISPSPWNIIGSISTAIDTSSARVTPSVAGLRGSSFFKYSAGYQATDSLKPGGGYWVKANSVGSFHLHKTGTPVAPAKGAVAGRSIDDLNVLTIQDANGGLQKLYFGADGKNEIPVDMFAMPPQPPAGSFDARFVAEGGMMVQTHAEEVSDVIEMPIAIQSVAYPLTVSWKVNGSASTYELSDASGSHAVQGEGSLKINNSAVNHLTLKVTSGSTLPKEFALSQNYPNPFNPTTNIKYALPVDSKLTMEIYNILGQKVRTLLAGEQAAGYHSVEWNGKGNEGQQLASGVYFLQMSAAGANGKKFSELKKLMLMK